jgi:hypothetical protein
MNAEDAEKLKLDPTNEYEPYIVLDKSERCHLWENHHTCDGVIMIGQKFHVYCSCECHHTKNA